VAADLEEVISVNDNAGSEMTAQFDLHERRDMRHDHRDGDVEIMTVICQCQRLVACTRRYYTSSLLLL